MGFPGRETQITRDVFFQVGEHILREIRVSQVVKAYH